MVNRTKPIIKMKKMMSRESIQPSVKGLKCVMTLSEATRSTSHGFVKTSKVISNRRRAAHDEEHADDKGENEADDLIAGHRGSHATDRQISTGHQKAAHVSGENQAVVGRAEVIDGDDDWEGQEQRAAEENPGGEKFTDDGLPRGDWFREQEFNGADAAFFGPESHADAGDENEVEPWVPFEERVETRLAHLEQIFLHGEGEKSGEGEKDDDENISERRREITGEFAFGDGFDVSERVHFRRKRGDLVKC